MVYDFTSTMVVNIVSSFSTIVDCIKNSLLFRSFVPMSVLQSLKYGGPKSIPRAVISILPKPVTSC